MYVVSVDSSNSQHFFVSFEVSQGRQILSQWSGHLIKVELPVYPAKKGQLDRWMRNLCCTKCMYDAANIMRRFLQWWIVDSEKATGNCGCQPPTAHLSIFHFTATEVGGFSQHAITGHVPLNTSYGQHTHTLHFMKQGIYRCISVQWTFCLCNHIKIPFFKYLLNVIFDKWQSFFVFLFYFCGSCFITMDYFLTVMWKKMITTKAD